MEAEGTISNLESKMKALKTRHGAVHEADLPHKSDILLAEGKAIVKSFQTWQLTAVAVQEGGLVALTAEVSGGEAKLLDVDAKVKKQLQTMMYVSTIKSSESRASYQARRWRISKMEQGFVKGKFDGGMSSVLAKALNRIFEGVNAAGDDGKIMVDPKCLARIAVNQKWAQIDQSKPAL